MKYVPKEKIFERVYKDLLKKIQTGIYKPGDRLPTEFELMRIYGISRSTAGRALNMLADDWLVERSRHNGTFVKSGEKKEGQAYRVAFVLPYDKNFNYDIVVGAHEYASEKGMFMSMFNSENNNEKERQLLGRILVMSVDGLIINPSSFFSNLDLFHEFSRRGIPICFFDRDIAGIEGSLVSADNRRGTYDLIKYLIAQGHRKIACLPLHDNLLSSTRARFEGFCRAMAEAGLPIHREHIFRTDFDFRHKMSTLTPSEQYALTKSCMETFGDQYMRLDPKPTAIICYNDRMALMLMDVLKKKGLRIPEDVSIAGFDDIAAAAAAKPPLTTVKQDFYRMGKASAQCVYEMIANGLSQTRLIDTKLIVRQSTGRIL